MFVRIKIQKQMKEMFILIKIEKKMQVKNKTFWTKLKKSITKFQLKKTKLFSDLGLKNHLEFLNNIKYHRKNNTNSISKNNSTQRMQKVKIIQTAFSFNHRTRKYLWIWTENWKFSSLKRNWDFKVQIKLNLLQMQKDKKVWK